MAKKVIFLDAGHGGINPKTREYTTAPSKMFKHRQGEFHDKTTFYEGVKNRKYCKDLHLLLNKMDITVIPVYHEYRDTPLHVRTKLANDYHTNVAEGIYISEHSNATSQHTAIGFSAWTSPGESKSDEYAESFIEAYDQKFMKSTEWAMWSMSKSAPQMKILSNTSDGDRDYEARFHVLTQTKMPAVLFENLFFDHYEDATMLQWTLYRREYTQLQAEWIRSIV